MWGGCASSLCCAQAAVRRRRGFRRGHRLRRLVGPHIARLLVGEDHRLYLPASVLSSALLMSLASAASKILVPGALLPVGVVTAVIGVPAFLFLIFRSGARR
ncbi:iron chelate uptake ABC transporter family permease subunit [Brevundimonas sp.]|uniref:iron chelate uptake ABC transporter family permease subunit n=1 Tax=Brevundimonas sp. TaxID=1871086 RepID=UPI0035618764